MTATVPLLESIREGFRSSPRFPHEVRALYGQRQRIGAYLAKNEIRKGKDYRWQTYDPKWTIIDDSLSFSIYFRDLMDATQFRLWLTGLSPTGSSPS